VGEVKNKAWANFNPDKVTDLLKLSPGMNNGGLRAMHDQTGAPRLTAYSDLDISCYKWNLLM
jgi:hypothetical protein